MAALEIPCPQCGKRLSVPDRKLLGRKFRCGRCQHSFRLTEPAPPPPVVVFSSEPPTPQPDAEPETDQPAPPAPNPFNFAVEETPPEFPNFDLAPVRLPSVAATPTAEPLKARRSKRRGGKGAWIIAGLMLVIAGGVAFWFLRDRGDAGSPESAPSAGKQQAATPKGKSKGKATTQSKSRGKSVSPTKGQPITLRLAPMGARILINVRVAELWEPGSAGEEFRACLGKSLGAWLEEQIRTQCLIEPGQIEEALFALIPVSREEFDVAVVVRTRQAMKPSDLLDKIDGELIDLPRPHYVGERKAYLIADTRTFAIAPREMVDALLESVDAGGSVSSEGIEHLLPRTDRERHLTVVAELEDVRNSRETLVPENAQKLLQGVLEFFGDDVETVVWSLHLGDPQRRQDLHSELLVRNRGTRSPPKLQRDLEQKLAALPAELLKLVYQTNPRRLGEKKLVGRLPVMVKVVERVAQFESASRLVKVQWQLPERAGPNLALGTLLAWNQTNLPEFGQGNSQPGQSSRDDDPSLTIAQRLQKKIDVEFRDDFLYVAVDFISEETGIRFKLDGPGMKRVGKTQNEKQKFTMQQVPAGAILHRMLIPQRLVLIVDEQKKLATITSDEEAEDKKLKPFPLQPAP
ncbi:MAG: hypothetical protein ACKV0T_29755 [Planctomycetales bacterium]